jgi:hypothetical protein
MKEVTKEGFEPGSDLEISLEIEELEAKIAPDDNCETVIPMPRRRRR